MGCEYHHTQSCDCGACCLLPKNLYIFSFDVIKIVKKLFEQHKDNQTIIQALDEVDNPFGARLNIQAVDPTHFDEITNFITNKRNPV